MRVDSTALCDGSLFCSSGVSLQYFNQRLMFTNSSSDSSAGTSSDYNYDSWIVLLSQLHLLLFTLLNSLFYHR